MNTLMIYLRQVGAKVSGFSSQMARRFLESRQFRRRIGIGIFLLVSAIGISAALNPLKSGFVASYYDNSEWAGEPVMTIRETFQGLHRMRSLTTFASANYSIEWKGVLWIRRSGAYEFTTVSTDGSALYIGEQLVVDNRGAHDYQERRGSIWLEKGFYPLHLRYMLQGAHIAECKAFISRPGKQTGQAGIPLQRAPVFVEMPSRRTFMVGRGLRLVTLLGLAIGIGIVLICLHNRHILFPRWQRMLIATGVFLICFVCYFWGSDITTSFDSIWSIPTALSLVKEGNTNLDEYEAALKKHAYYYIDRIDDHYYTQFPLGTSLLAAPLVFLIDTLLDAGVSLDLDMMILQRTPAGIEMGIASVFVALTAAGIFLIAELLCDSLKQSLLLTGIFAFGTSAWSTASRALWQHGPSMLLLTGVLYVLVLMKDKEGSQCRGIRFISIPLVFAYIVRPTNSIPVLFVTLYVLLRYRKQFLPYCCWGTIVTIPFLLYNWRIYHALLAPYYSPHRLGGATSRFFEALAGHLISPSRGLFVFSPVLLFALYGIALKLRHREVRALDTVLLLCIVFHWLAISSFPVWWAGHSYGPRFFSDMLPLFVYFLIPAIKQFSHLQGIKKLSMAVLFFCTVMVSCWIHSRGATSWQVYEWNSYPVEVSSKLWDWHDLQFLRGIR